MEHAILVEHHVRPLYSAFILDTPTGLKRLFLQKDVPVSSKTVPRDVKQELQAALHQNMQATLDTTLQGGARRHNARQRQFVKARATTRAVQSMPRSVLDVVQLLPEPEAEILEDARRVAVHRPLSLGLSSQRRSVYGYQTPQTRDCHDLIEKRGGKLVVPAPKYNQCSISSFDFLNFVDFVTRHRKYDVHRYVEAARMGVTHPNGREEAALVDQYRGRTMCEKLLNVLPLPPGLTNKIRTQKWSVVRHLGQGEYGTTFLAVNQKGKQAAVKVMVETGQEEISPAEEFDMHRLFASMGLAPAAYYATSLTFQGTKLHIFVMERVEFTLYELLCFQRLSPSMLESIGYSLAKFLWTMYQKGVTHGDMHSQNIMFKYNSKSKRYEPKLIDFGFATTKFNDPEIDALQLMSDLNQLTRMSPVVVNYLVRVLSKVVSKIRGYEVKVGKRRSQWEEHVDQYIARRARAHAQQRDAPAFNQYEYS